MHILSGLTAIEMWMLSCILFIFGALIGISFYSCSYRNSVLLICRVRNHTIPQILFRGKTHFCFQILTNIMKIPVNPHTKQELSADENLRMICHDNLPTPVCGEDYVKVDRFFLAAMPLLFSIFNIIYWMSFGSHLILPGMEGNENH